MNTNNEANYTKFVSAIKPDIADEFIFTDKLSRLAYGTDASCYFLIPKVVIKAQNEKHIQSVLKHAHNLNLAVTFRAQGTSLSGQAVSNSILVIAREGWKNYSVSKDASTITLDVGINGSVANSYLKAFNKKIGPDPATIDVALIGGIVSNNSSGMCCGVDFNSYKTIKDIRLIFNDGTILDTADEDSVNSFKKTHSKLLSDLENLSSEVNSDKELAALIAKKFSIKNTTGYSINSLVDYKDGIEILKHLIVGSEGTLAFVSSVTYNTIEDYQNKASALIIFDGVEKACSCVSALQLLGNKLVNSAEFMDRVSLKVMENEDGVPDYLSTLPDGACAVLVQTVASSASELKDNIEKVTETVDKFNPIKPLDFKDNPIEYAKYWKIRKGLFTKVGAHRRKNTTVIIEDITFPIEKLAEGTINLRELLVKYNYEDAVIFGHSLAGNLHFVLVIDFSNQKELSNYEKFMTAMTDLVAVEYKGSLKAEHGTGRNIAPFVEKEWGARAYSFMCRIKEIFDPNNLINPDVIITKNPNLHLEDLKHLTSSNDLIDRCIECGFCEPKCPSLKLTFTPRQRIVTYRHMNASAYPELQKELQAQSSDYMYKAVDTCAACSTCSTVCPVGINVATLTKEIRHEHANSFFKFIMYSTIKTYPWCLKIMRTLLSFAHVASSLVGNNLITAVSSFANKTLGRIVPVWRSGIPLATSASNLKVLANNYPVLSANSTHDDKTFVYFVSCLNKIFGKREHPLLNNLSIFDVMENLAKKSGYKMILVSDDSLCCGSAFTSRGYKETGDYACDNLEKKLLEATQNGKYPIVSDLSSCTLQMVNGFKSDALKVYGVGTFAMNYFVPNLDIKKLNKNVALHLNCSSKKLNEEEDLLSIANMCASKVITPPSVSCCGFAGDRGLYTPELNHSALSELKKEASDCSMGFSTNSACEIGLSDISEKPYINILYLLDYTSMSRT